ncbi:hypothetical protein SUS17_1981 [Sphingomonas sp. S17]|nr:hypothetical protein SUS17_1981 [Sphingomonas sp. S17]
MHNRLNDQYLVEMAAIANLKEISHGWRLVLWRASQIVSRLPINGAIRR